MSDAARHPRRCRDPQPAVPVLVLQSGSPVHRRTRGRRGTSLAPHSVSFELYGRRRMVDLDSFDEYVVNALRGSSEPDEDYVGKPAVSCDQRFQLSGGTAGDARRLADRVQTFADQLRAAADELQRLKNDAR